MLCLLYRKILKDANSFSEVIANFLEIKGIGIKIATMAANLLDRHLNIGENYSDKHFMDISPDTHVKQIFHKLGFVDAIFENKINIYLQSKSIVSSSSLSVG